MHFFVAEFELTHFFVVRKVMHAKVCFPESFQPICLWLKAWLTLVESCWKVSLPLDFATIPEEGGGGISLFYFFQNTSKVAHLLTQAVYTPKQSVVKVSEFFSGKSRLATLFRL